MYISLIINDFAFLMMTLDKNFQETFNFIVKFW